MSYSSFSRTSREIALFSITYIASYLLHMSCRLTVHCTVYCDYDNSSVLLNDNICTLPSIEFYLSSIYILLYIESNLTNVSVCLTTYRIIPCCMILQLYTWLIIYLMELSVRLELTTVVYKTTVLPVKLRKHVIV